MAEPSAWDLKSTRKYVVLGVHDAAVQTVEGNWLRIRMFVGPDRTVYDEDFPIPDLDPSMPKTIEVYERIVKNIVHTRIAELEG